jgi:cytochrome c553
MRALNVRSADFLSAWLLSLFVRSLPSETAARVWDALLCEGPKVLVRVAVALLKMAEVALLAAPDASAFATALRLACGRCHDRDALQAAAFDSLGSLPRARLDALRKAAAEELVAERAEASLRRSSYSVSAPA